MDDLLDIGLGFSKKNRVNSALRDYSLENYDLSDPDQYGREAMVAYNAMESCEIRNKLVAQNAILKMKMLNRIQKAYGRESAPLAKRLYEMSLEEAEKLEEVGESTDKTDTKSEDTSEKKTSVIKKFFMAILNALKKFWNWVKEVWTKFINWIKKLFGKETTNSESETETAASELTEEIKKMEIGKDESLEETSSKLFKLFSKMKSAASSVANGTKAVASNINDGVRGVLGNINTKLKSIAEERDEATRIKKYRKAKEEIEKAKIKADLKAKKLEEAARIAEEKDDEKRYKAYQKAQADQYNREVKAQQRAAKLEEAARIAEEKDDEKRYKAYQKAQADQYNREVKAEQRAAKLEEKEDTKRYKEYQKDQADSLKNQIKAEKTADKMAKAREPLQEKADQIAKIIHAYRDSIKSKNCQIRIDESTLNKMESFVDAMTGCINKLIVLMKKYISGVGHDVDIGLKDLWKEIGQKFGSALVRDGGTDWKYSIKFEEQSKDILGMIFGKDKVVDVTAHPLTITDFSKPGKTVRVIKALSGKFTKIEGKYDKVVESLKATGEKVANHDVKAGGSQYPTLYADMSKSLSFFVKTTADFITKPLVFIQSELKFLVSFGEQIKVIPKLLKNAKRVGVNDEFEMPYES